MSYRLVLDASTLILLAKTELLPILLGEGKAVITPEVRDEATVREDLFDAKIVAQLVTQGKLDICSAEGKIAHRLVLDFRLGLGEASSIALAKELKAVLGTDDGVAIKACKILGIPFVTAIHFLIQIYERKELDCSLALVKLEKLQQFGRYNARILEEAIRYIEGGDFR